MYYAITFTQACAYVRKVCVCARASSLFCECNCLVCICPYVCMYVCCVYANIHACIQMSSIHACMYESMLAYMRAYAHTYMHAYHSKWLLTLRLATHGHRAAAQAHLLQQAKAVRCHPVGPPPHRHQQAKAEPPQGVNRAAHPRQAAIPIPTAQYQRYRVHNKQSHQTQTWLRRNHFQAPVT